jgi:hypothetical protein
MPLIRNSASPCRLSSIVSQMLNREVDPDRETAGAIF